jgi:DNA-binding transcriptional regulator YdaS (Cro superfamily)
MSATTVKLLQAASEIAGGDRALADRLGVSMSLLSKFLANDRDLPDLLLLRAVDIILADRQSRLPQAAHPAVIPLRGPRA